MSERTFCFAISMLLAGASFVEAQNSFQQLGTRRGAVAGAIIGGIIGGQNDEVAAGIVTGGLIGGAAGNIIGTRMDINQELFQPRYQQPTPFQRYPSHAEYEQHAVPTLAPQFHSAYDHQVRRNQHSGWKQPFPRSMNRSNHSSSYSVPDGFVPPQSSLTSGAATRITPPPQPPQPFSVLEPMSADHSPPNEPMIAGPE